MLKFGDKICEVGHNQYTKNFKGKNVGCYGNPTVLLCTITSATILLSMLRVQCPTEISSGYTIH